MIDLLQAEVQTKITHCKKVGIFPSDSMSEDEDEWETPSITPEPKKAKQQEAAKKISEKISKRYTDILKKKK